MVHTFYPEGVCCEVMDIELDDNNVVQSLRVEGGCEANLNGIGALIKGMPAQEVINRLKGIPCEDRDGLTSCPDQLARGLEEILASQKK